MGEKILTAIETKKIHLQITYEKNTYIKSDLRRTDQDKSMCSSSYFSMNMENTHYSEFMKDLVLSILFIHTFLVHFRHITHTVHTI